MTVKTYDRHRYGECETNYRQLKTNTVSCSVCGMTEDESPDSRPNEIKLYYKYDED